MQTFTRNQTIFRALRPCIRKSRALLCACLFFYWKSSSQTTYQAAPGNAAAYTIQHYQQALGKTTHLYNGAEYIRPFPLIKGSPFLEAGLQKGAVLFDGVLYPNVMLAYDIVSQQLVTTGYQNINLTLVPQKIDYFYLANRLFIPAPTDSATHNKPVNGFCEVLYNNGLQVLAHYQKTPKRSSGAEAQDAYNTYTSYYMMKGRSISKINSDKALIAALPEHKEQVKQFMRAQQLKFKKAPAETLVKVAGYYTQLNQ